jgi:subtilisin family serine protease
MEPLELIKLRSLMPLSSGSPELVIGVIDGPVNFEHPAFHDSKIRTVKDFQLSACKSASSIACMHGTFVAGILCAKREGPAPAICPSCKIVLYPIFNENSNGNDIAVPSSTPEELSKAIIETVDAGARIINLSLGMSSSSLIVYHSLQEAYSYALQKGAIIVAAAGNQGNIGYISLINHQWLIPVAACDEYGQLDSISNFGPSIGTRGLMAPGVNIRSTTPGGEYAYMSGTSFAVPFVTGAIALLWSIFSESNAAEIIHSLVLGSSNNRTRRSVIPRLLNAEAALNILRRL